MGKIKVYFSDFFEVDEDIIEEYGAVNISLINDLPLFIDPFLLFNSKNPDFQKIHKEMINYLMFLQNQSERTHKLTPGMKKAWFSFSEVKQTWLGFSLSGNNGCGMGNDFANSLYEGLNSIFKNFGEEKITKGHHMEKLCLISPRVGRDKISDFTTNFANLTPPDVTERLLQSLPGKPVRCWIRTSRSVISGAGWLRERSIFISMGKTGKWKAEADCTEAVQQLPLF